MPRNVLLSLEHLSIYSVAAHWNELGINSITKKNYENISLIKHLPEALLNEIKGRLRLLLYKPFTFQDLQLFTCRPITLLNLKQYSITKSKLIQSIQYLLPRLRSIKCLTISNEFVQLECPDETRHDSSKQIYMPGRITIFQFFLQSLSNITYLSFKETQCQDWMLTTVSKYCIHLLELNVSYCDRITDNGIMALVADAKHINEFDFNINSKHILPIREYQPLPYLQRVWLIGTSTTQDSIVQLLISYPDLKICYHQELFKIFTFLYTSHNNEISKDLLHLPLALLKELVCNQESLSLLSNVNILWNYIWSLNFMELSSNTDLAFLSGLQNLQELYISSAKSEEKCGLNLSILAVNCPRLKKLTLNISGRIKFTHSVPQSAFHLINSLTINGMKAESLSASDAFKLLSRCTSLQVLHLCQCPWLSDKILEDIIRLNPLHHIQYLSLFKTKLSVDGMLKLLDMKNNLKMLSTSSTLLCIRQRHYFANYIRCKNWDLIFKLYTA